MLALLEAGGPFASLRSFKWNFNGDYILHMAQETEAGELMRPGAYLRFSDLLRNLNVAHLEMIEGGSGEFWSGAGILGDVFANGCIGGLARVGGLHV